MFSFKTYLIEGGKSEDILEAAAEIGFIAKQKTYDAIKEFFNYSVDPKFQKTLWELFNKAWKNVGTIINKTKSGYDISGKDVFIDIQNYSKPQYKKVHKKTKKKVQVEALEIMSIIAGVYEFKKSVLAPYLGEDIGFVHKNISGYYEWEEEIVGIKKGSKGNTTDIVLTSKSNVKLLQKIISERDKTISAKSNLAKGYVSLTKGKKELLKYFQISLKKSTTGAQLGNVNTLIALLYDPESATSVAVGLTSSYVPFGEFLVEGFFGDLFFKVKNFVVEKLSKLNSFIKNLFNKLKDKFLSITTISPTDIKFVMSELGIDEVLVEAARGKGVAAGDKTKKTLSQLFKTIPEMIKLTNKKINQVKKLSEGTNILVMQAPIKNKGDVKKSDFSGGSAIKDINSKGNVTKTVFSMIGNLATLNKLKSIMNHARTDIEDFKTNFVGELTSETIYGGSSLPLWMVYGKDFSTNEKPFKYIETRNASAEKTVELINNKKFLKNLPIVGVMFQGDQKLLGKHYTIKIFILKELQKIKDELQYVYIHYKTGSHFNTKFSDVFNAKGFVYVPFGGNPLNILKSEMDKSK